MWREFSFCDPLNLVAQAFLPVPQFDCGSACAKRESEKMRWVMYRRPLAGVFEVARTAETRINVKGAGRRPAVRTAEARRTMRRGSQAFAICAAWQRGAQATFSRTACWRGLCYW